MDRCCAGNLIVARACACSCGETYASFAVGPNVATLDTTDVGKLRPKEQYAYGAKFRALFRRPRIQLVGLEVDMYRSQSNVKRKIFRDRAPIFFVRPIPGSDFLVHSLHLTRWSASPAINTKLSLTRAFGIGLNMGNISMEISGRKPPLLRALTLAGVKYYFTRKSPLHRIQIQLRALQL